MLPVAELYPRATLPIVIGGSLLIGAYLNGLGKLLFRGTTLGVLWFMTSFFVVGEIPLSLLSLLLAILYSVISTYPRFGGSRAVNMLLLPTPVLPLLFGLSRPVTPLVAYLVGVSVSYLWTYLSPRVGLNQDLLLPLLVFITEGLGLPGAGGLPSLEFYIIGGFYSLLLTSLPLYSKETVKALRWFGDKQVDYILSIDASPLFPKVGTRVEVKVLVYRNGVSTTEVVPDLRVVDPDGTEERPLLVGVVYGRFLFEFVSSTPGKHIVIAELNPAGGQQVRVAKTLEVVPKRNQQKAVQTPTNMNTNRDRVPALPDTVCKWDANLWVGQTIWGYRVDSVIGCGGTGIVMKGYDSRGNLVAIKVPILCGDPCRKGVSLQEKPSTVVGDMMRETGNLISLTVSSKYLVGLVGVFLSRSIMEESFSNPYAYLTAPPAIITEFVRGGTFQDVIGSNKEILLSTKWDRAVCNVLKSVSLGLRELHNYDFVHLDVKPSNLFLTDKIEIDNLQDLVSGRVTVKLGDLGSARRVGEQFTQVTPLYSSPEQLVNGIKSVRGDRNSGASKPMDIYSLGATAFTIRTGRSLNLPMLKEINSAIESRDPGGIMRAWEKFDSTGVVERDHDLKDSPLKDLLKSMVEKDPERRPSIAEVISSLEKIC